MNVIIEENKKKDGVSVFYYKYTLEKKRVKKLCRNCTSLNEAKMFVDKVFEKKNEQYLIKNISKEMFFSGSLHMQRLEAFGKELDLKTIKQKRHIIDIICEKFGDYSIKKITVRDIETYLLKDTHSASWKNMYIDTFGSIFDETHWKCDTPVNRLPLKRFTRKSRKADILSKQEMSQILQVKNFSCMRDYLFFLTMALCGLRMGETRGIKVEQFDFVSNILVVNGFIKHDGTRTCYNKKGSEEDTKIRIVPIPEFLRTMILSYITYNHFAADDYIFADELGFIPTTDHMDWIFKKAVKYSGINKGNRKIVPHSFRFTYVTRLRSTVPAETVQKIVGHSSVEMTEYYTRFSLEDLKDGIKPAKEAVNQILEF